MALEAGLTSPGLVSLACRTHKAREKVHRNHADLLYRSFQPKERNKKNLSLEIWSTRHHFPEFIEREDNDPFKPISEPKQDLNDLSLRDRFYSADMDNPEYFHTKQFHSKLSSSESISPLRRSQSEARKPPLPPDLSSTKSLIYSNLGLRECMKRTTSSEIAGKVSKFEHLAVENKLGSKGNNFSKSLWYFRDGLRSPTTPPPEIRKDHQPGSCYFEFGKDTTNHEAFSQSLTQIPEPRQPSKPSSFHEAKQTRQNVNPKEAKTKPDLLILKNFKKSKGDLQQVKVKLSTTQAPLPMPPAVIVTIPTSFTLGSKFLPKSTKSSSVTPRKSKNNKEKSSSSGNLISRLIPSIQARKIDTLNAKNSKVELPNLTNTSPKLFQKSEKTVNISAELVLGRNCYKPNKSPNSSVSISSDRNSPDIKSPSPRPVKSGEVQPQNTEHTLKKQSIENLKLEEILDICADYEKELNSFGKESKHTTKNDLNDTFQSNNLPLPSSPGHNLQVSPGGSLLTPNRIKTNGSLARETRLGSRSPQPATPTFMPSKCAEEDIVKPDGNHSSSSWQTSSLNGHMKSNKQLCESHYVNLLPQNQRLKSDGENENVNQMSTTEGGNLQGGGEDLYSSSKVIDEVYEDAKALLDSLTQTPMKIDPTEKRPPVAPSKKSSLMTLKSASNFPFSNLPGLQRRPPKSKHDLATDQEASMDKNSQHRFPSSEAGHRMLIGTLMLQNGGNSKYSPSKSGSSLASKSQTFQQLDISRATKTSDMNKIKALDCKLDLYKSQRNCQILLVWSLKKKLAELESKMTEDIKQLELEYSLLAAECDAEKDKLRKIQLKLSDLQVNEARLSSVFEEWQKVERTKIDIAKSLVDKAEIELQRLDFEHSKFLSFECEIFNNDPDAFVKEEAKILEKIKSQHDTVEAARKRYEDMEFHQMEEATLKEAEKEELNKEICEQKRLLDHHLKLLREFEDQQKSILKFAKEETMEFKQQRESILEQFKQEKVNLSKINKALNSGPKHNFNDKSKSCDALQRSYENVLEEDSDSNSEKEDYSTKRNLILEASLNKLALLEKELSVFEDNLVNQRKSDLNKNEVRNNFSNFLNQSQTSIGISEDEMTSINSKSKKSLESFFKDSGSSIGQTSDEFSRSMLSFSDDNFIRKRENFQKLQQRPLTRYLPIRGECFDLRNHIETAGHQIDLCKHIEVDGTSCRGFLFKMSGPKSKHLRTWNKRFFVFDRKKKVLAYFQDRLATRPKGYSYFEEIQEVYVDHLNAMKSPHPTMTFCIKTTNRIFFLIAPSPESMRIWVDVIFTGAEGYREFQND